jgi:hypothetical protein
MLRAELLYEKAKSHLFHAAGSRNEHAKAAMDRALQVSMEHLRKEVSDYPHGMESVFMRMYPEKAECAGTAALAELTRAATRASETAGITESAGRGLIAGLLFGFGHGVLEDPLYPWIARTLSDPLLAPAARTERLFNKVHTYLRHMALYFAEADSHA